MRITANGIHLNAEIEGKEGAPWIVFSNSLATNLSMWDAQVAALRDRFRILRYDQRGHGKSDAPDGRYSFDQLTADVAALLDALKIGRAHFVGLSMGGMTGLLLAQKHRNQIEKLVACDCGAASSPQSAQQWQERIALAREKGMDALVEPTVTRWFAPESLTKKKPVIDKVREMIRTTPVNGFIGCAYALSDFDLRGGLRDIAAPTLFLCGSKDASLPATKALHAALTGSHMTEIDGVGHISNMEGEAEFTKALLDFLG